MAPDEARRFSIAVSDSLRKYIEGRFRIGATHQTTLEFLRQLALDKPDVLLHHANGLEEFLQHCDLAKFAQWRLSQEEMQAMFKSAWEFVEQTRPSGEEEASGRKPRRSRKKQKSAMVDLAAHGGAT